MTQSMGRAHSACDERRQEEQVNIRVREARAMTLAVTLVLGLAAWSAPPLITRARRPQAHQPVASSAGMSPMVRAAHFSTGSTRGDASSSASS